MQQTSVENAIWRPSPLITVFSLKAHLASSPNEVAEVQARTLDNRSFPGGLKGANGLYGSEAWWRNIANGTIPTKTIRGEISEVYTSGMENLDHDFVMRMDHGATYTYGCIANEKKNLVLYRVGSKIEIDLVVEELKKPVKTSVGFETHIDEILEIRLSAS